MCTILNAFKKSFDIAYKNLIFPLNQNKTHMNITETLRKRLITYMRNEKRSLRYVAVRVEIVSYQSIHNFLKGRHDPTGKLINAVDGFLNSEGY